MPKAAVVGQPIAHSLSPALHRAAYQALGLRDWTYERIECDEAGFAAMLDGLDHDWRGLSVTMPGKRAALAAAVQATQLARAVGAANTLVRHEDGWHADNTDVAGIVGALGEAGVQSAAGAVILGAGGTAQAALAALARLDEPAPIVLVRSVARTTDLQATAERLGVRPQIREGLDDPILRRAPVLISTLPKGAADPLAGGDWADGVLFDVVYDPWPTTLAASAAAAGRRVISGLDMLLHQAIDQVRLMTGQPGPIDAMRAALARAASARRS
jgi:shikimate dehydrogenase